MIQAFQTVLAKQFKFDEINDFLQNGGDDAPEFSKMRKKSLVSFGDILKPVIANNGEFLGL